MFIFSCRVQVLLLQTSVCSACRPMYSVHSDPNSSHCRLWAMTEPYFYVLLKLLSHSSFPKESQLYFAGSQMVDECRWALAGTGLLYGDIKCLTLPRPHQMNLLFPCSSGTEYLRTARICYIVTITCNCSLKQIVNCRLLSDFKLINMCSLYLSLVGRFVQRPSCTMLPSGGMWLVLLRWTSCPVNCLRMCTAV